MKDLRLRHELKRIAMQRIRKGSINIAIISERNRDFRIYVRDYGIEGMKYFLVQCPEHLFGREIKEFLLIDETRE